MVPGEPLLSVDWTAPARVRAITTQRCGAGVSGAPFDQFNLGGHCGDDPDAVVENRKLLMRLAQLPSPPRWLRQVHGCAVVHQDEVASSELPQADAAITDVSNVVLAILTADCLPVLFCADDGSEVAAAHAGWRGLANGVLERTVAAMRAPATRILAWLGPAAGPSAYEVGDEVREVFLTDDAATSLAFRSTRPGHHLCDLFALARRRMQRAGVSRIFGGGRCTISAPHQFFSHRRDGRCGRQASLIWLDSQN